MKKTFFTGIGIILFCCIPLFGQIQQAERAKERRERLIRASEERERQKEESGRVAAVKTRATVMNTDVRMVLSRDEYKTFAEAQAKPINRVADGEPIWLNLKFNGKLGDYVFAQPDKEVPGKLRYVLFSEIGPLGDVTALTQFNLVFSPSELTATELHINLAPGIFGKNKSIPLLLKTADNTRPGVWQNEFRIANTAAIPRGPNDFLAKLPVTLDLSGTHTKYRQMWAEYDSMILRGTADAAKMPVEGTFFSSAIKDEVDAKLKAASIVPAKFYFSDDDWGEVASSAFSLQDATFSAKKERRIFATYTYQKFGSCLYGVAKVIQSFDEMSAKYLTSAVDLMNDFPIDCRLLN